jgi:single-strand DNA-binding protein
MALPTLTGVARLTADPELRFTGNGKAVASVRLAFNARRLNQQTQQWEDGDVFYVRGQAWERLAENICETLTKGMEVTVTGDLRTERWEKDGQRHEMPSLTIRSIGPSLAFAVATVRKPAAEQAPPDAQRGQQRGQAARQQPADDPWATGATEPPF